MTILTIGFQAALHMILGAVLTQTSGCDFSKEELERTKTERAQYKTLLATTQYSMDAMKKEIAEVKARAIICQQTAAPIASAAAVAPAHSAKPAPAHSDPAQAQSAPAYTPRKQKPPPDFSTAF